MYEGYIFEKHINSIGAAILIKLMAYIGLTSITTSNIYFFHYQNFKNA